VKSPIALLALRVLIVLVCLVAVGLIFSLPPESTIPNLVYEQF
jgi:hypothetical protein